MTWYYNYISFQKIKLSNSLLYFWSPVQYVCFTNGLPCKKIKSLIKKLWLTFNNAIFIQLHVKRCTVFTFAVTISAHKTSTQLSCEYFIGNIIQSCHQQLELRWAIPWTEYNEELSFQEKFIFDKRKLHKKWKIDQRSFLKEKRNFVTVIKRFKKTLCISILKWFLGQLNFLLQWHNFTCKHQKLSKLHSRVLETIHLQLLDIQVLIVQTKLFCRRFGLT